MTLPRLILPDTEKETVEAGVLGVGLWRRLVATLKLLGGGSRKQVIEHDGYEVMVEATHQHGQDSGRVRVEGGGYVFIAKEPEKWALGKRSLAVRGVSLEKTRRSTSVGANLGYRLVESSFLPDEDGQTGVVKFSVWKPSGGKYVVEIPLLHDEWVGRELAFAYVAVYGDHYAVMLYWYHGDVSTDYRYVVRFGASPVLRLTQPAPVDGSTEYFVHNFAAETVSKDAPSVVYRNEPTDAGRRLTYWVCFPPNEDRGFEVVEFGLDAQEMGDASQSHPAPGMLCLMVAVGDIAGGQGLLPQLVFKVIVVTRDGYSMKNFVWPSDPYQEGARSSTSWWWGTTAVSNGIDENGNVQMAAWGAYEKTNVLPGEAHTFFRITVGDREVQVPGSMLGANLDMFGSQGVVYNKNGDTYTVLSLDLNAATDYSPYPRVQYVFFRLRTGVVLDLAPKMKACGAPEGSLHRFFSYSCVRGLNEVIGSIDWKYGDADGVMHWGGLILSVNPLSGELRKIGVPLQQMNTGMYGRVARAAYTGGVTVFCDTGRDDEKVQLWYCGEPISLSWVGAELRAGEIQVNNSAFYEESGGGGVYLITGPHLISIKIVKGETGVFIGTATHITCPVSDPRSVYLT